MAIAGGATTAYRCVLWDGDLMVGARTTALSTLCVSVPDALVRLARGEQVLVAGGDVMALRAQLQCAIWRIPPDSRAGHAD